jgi:hypothetical protein
MTAAQIADGMGVVRHVIRDIGHELYPDSAAGGHGYDYNEAQTEAIKKAYGRRMAGEPRPGMTTREIAQSTGRELRAVQYWVKLAGAKIASIRAKNASSTSTHPATYSVAEVCEIIEQGLGEAAAAVYRSNALGDKSAAPPATTVIPRPKPDATPSASFIREMRTTYGPIEAGKRLDFLIGYVPREPSALKTAQGLLALESDR